MSALPDRTGQVWETQSGLIVLVVSSDPRARAHRLLVLRGWSDNPGELQGGDMWDWFEEPGGAP